MTQILAITNQKGGVGKTTTSVNLAASLAQSGLRVLLVDLDPQANATMGSGLEKRRLSVTVYDVLLGLATLASALVTTPHGFSVLPANHHLAGAEVELVDIGNRDYRLRDALLDHTSDFDYILIDCPPALNLLTINALAAARAVVIPMQCEYYALEGLSDLVATIRRIHKSINPDLEIEGLLRTMFDPRNTLAQQVSLQLEQHFGTKVFSTVVPRNVRLAEAPSYGKPGVLFDATCKGSVAYSALAAELLERHRELPS